jgi:uncharacterized protein (TIGR02145 family)
MLDVIARSRKATRQSLTLFLLFLTLAFLAACGGDASSSASSTALNESERAGLSRHCEDVPEECDEVISSSSNVESEGSSDSRDTPSSAGTSTKSSNSNSSGTTTKSSNSSADEVNCSALLEEERKNKKWSWDVPKECRFNPDIVYGSMTDGRDGRVYRTVTIGDGENAQTWMAENLNYFDESLNGRSHCYYESNRSDGGYNYVCSRNRAVVGMLYQWTAAVGKTDDECGMSKICNLGDGKIQGICPDGWHLPSNKEWRTLIANVGGKDNAGRRLRSKSGWYFFNESYNGSDDFGFSALPAGYMESAVFGGTGNETHFWSSTEADVDCAYGLKLWCRSDGVALYQVSGGKVSSSYVRCLKD